MYENIAYNRTATLTWQNAPHICALSDGERHLGHVVRVGGRWHAYDAMHSNATGDGFLTLGTFAAVEAAQQAVEQSFLLLPVSLAGAA